MLFDWVGARFFKVLQGMANVSSPLVTLKPLRPNILLNRKLENLVDQA